MGDKSNIEWTDATWNPTVGCTRISSGCARCYAFSLHDMRHKAFMAGKKLPKQYAKPFSEVQTFVNRLDQPLKWKRPRKIFVNSLSDLFHKDIPDDFIDQVFAVMALCPQHTFQVLTKRPERMRQYLNERHENVRESLAFNAPDGQKVINQLGGTWIPPQYGEYGRIELQGYFDGINIAWPLPNVWLGVSVENQKAADERIPLLLQTPAAVRFLSCEPLLGPVDIKAYLWDIGTWEGYEHEDHIVDKVYSSSMEDGIDWIIVGGESGHGARPMHPDWARSIRDQCQAAGISFFFKQWGQWAPLEGDLPKNDKVIDYLPDNDNPKTGEYTIMHGMGKYKSGRLLDGREWNEFPEVRH